jgi:CRP-like cAMP-binding protein
LRQLQEFRRETATYDPRSIIVRARNAPNALYTLVEGWAFRYVMFPDGRRQILSFLLPGDFMMIQGMQLRPMPFSIQALTAVTVCSFDAAAFAKFFWSREDLMVNLGRVCVAKSAALDFRIIDLGRRTATERIARFMIEIGARVLQRDLGEVERFPFPLRQAHMADALGLTVVHVSRTIASLRKRGLISVKNGTLTIHDRDRLEDLAGGTFYRNDPIN